MAHQMVCITIGRPILIDGFFFSPYFFHTRLAFMSRNSVVGMGTRNWIRRSGDRIPVEATFSSPTQTGPGAHPASCTISISPFPWRKWAGVGQGFDHPPLIKRQGQTKFKAVLWTFMDCYTVNFTFTFTFTFTPFSTPVVWLICRNSQSRSSEY